MQRHVIEPRPDWRQKLVDKGFDFATIDGNQYWRDDVVYSFTAQEVDDIEDATCWIWDDSMEIIDAMVRQGDYRGYNLPDHAISLVEKSWKACHPSLMARMDLAFDKKGQLKLYEINGDTPTSLPEASVWQWYALEDRGWPDQFNSIHEKLINWFSLNKNLLRESVHFAAMEDAPNEDWTNLYYLMETAAYGGIEEMVGLTVLPIEKVGWNEDSQTFRDHRDWEIKTLFKLYPWEWIIHDEFGKNVEKSKTLFINPPWTILLSKPILPRLWKEDGKSKKWLLPAFEVDDFPRAMERYPDVVWARKPKYGREGQGVSIGGGNETVEGHTVIFQRFHDAMAFDGMTPVLGSWVVGGEPAGMGIREDVGITTNNSFFVPHYFT